MGGHASDREGVFLPPSNSDCILKSRQLLHLHPLTLEDILQQEPREKLELFPSLGYYFTVFRAVKAWDGGHVKSGTQSIPTSESTVDEVYIYLIVFKQGICTVRFLFALCSSLKSYASFTLQTSLVREMLVPNEPSLTLCEKFILNVCGVGSSILKIRL